MGRGGQIKKLFPAGNTAQGFYSFFDSVVEGLDRIYIINGGPGTGKSTFMRRIGLTMVDRGYDVEFLYSSSDNDSLNGLVIPLIKLALMDGALAHHLKPARLGQTWESLNLEEFWDQAILEEYQEPISKGNQLIRENYDMAYAFLKEANDVHKRWKSYLSQGRNFKKADNLAEEIIAGIFARKPRVRHVFASAITPEGFINHIDNITKEIKTRYIIKGKVGMGKSSLLNKILQAGLERGYDLEVFHCALNPESIDMLIIPELSTAIINSEAPHLIEVSKGEDRIIDMQEYVIFKGLKNDAGEMNESEARFNHLIEQAITFLAQAKKANDKIETYYIEAMNYEALDKLRQRILNKILAFADQQDA